MIIASQLYSNNELYHHGVLGMKWGVRRYQPYPSDYHGDGKFVGPKQQKKNAKELIKAYKTKTKTYDPVTEATKNMLQTKTGKEGLDKVTKSPEYKKWKDISNKYNEAFDRYAEGDEAEMVEWEPKYRALEPEYIKARKAMAKVIKSYLNDALGDYGHTKVKYAGRVMGKDSIGNHLGEALLYPWYYND